MSVLLPVRDAERTLEACLRSLAAQTLTEHEVVAIDDGSIDATPRLLAAAARRDARLRVESTAPRGLVAALNHGLARVRAPLVARMDADDVAAPRRLEVQAHRFAVGDVEVLASRVALVGKGIENAGMARYVAWQNMLLTHEEMTRDLFVECPLVHPSAMLPAAGLRRLGGWREDGPEDYDLWLRAWAAGWRFAKLPQVLLEWRDHAGRLTRSDPRYAEEAFRVRKLRALLDGPLAGTGRGVVVWGAGPIGKWWSRALRRAGCPVVAFVEVAPRRLGQRIHGVPVVGVAQAPGRGPLHLAAVAGLEARERIRAAGRAAGLEDGRDLIAVA